MYSEKPRAIAVIRGSDAASSIFGTVEFTQINNCVSVTADISGLPKNGTDFYGFHIHEGYSCAGNDFADSKGHFNPTASTHPNHAGDLPPLIRCGNMAHIEFLTDRFRVPDIIGRTVIIHSMPDDFSTQPSGNSGRKIACGVIELL